MTRACEASADIQASPEQAWSILIDGSSWPAWDSGVDGVEGRIAPDETITVRSKASPGRPFPVKVTVFGPSTRLVLEGGMPLGLFTGVRKYSLAAAKGGATRFHVGEEYGGPLLGVVGRSIPDLAPSFTTFANGLKRRAEAG